MTEITPTDTSCGFIALVGAPNAGKSTLLNSLVGTKVSIVTHKAQTTRSQVRGVVTTDKSQLVFIDTPGIFAPKRRLDRAMVDSAWGGAGDADIVALIVDVDRGLTPELEKLLEGLDNINHPRILILNKIDTIKNEELLKLSEAINANLRFEATFMISALKGYGVSDFMDWCIKHIPPGPWHFPEDHLTDLTMAITAAEITREKLFLRVHDEIPYNSTVETESFKIQKDGSYKIDQVIYLSRESHKKIVLGAGGQTIKSIGAESRKELMAMYEVPIHLFLFVKVREKWGDDPERYREMGLEYPHGKD
ncbi:GTPase Era [Devosia psychrophila]|uniref:GTPase Era n=1 Tax=Devosia psychrophila TaxID=728005 RepID=A0A0F5PVY1_9HYPH|nr:GTPase Era [Devosia psychrophila]KKC31994.1 GTPase Era [Devosia psychrophila]SFC75239.1 GTP-binding protein Era [Devosia psychrophila]